MHTPVVKGVLLHATKVVTINVIMGTQPTDLAQKTVRPKVATGTFVETVVFALAMKK